MLTTSGYLDINDGTNQSFIVELGFLGVPSDEIIEGKGIFITLFLTSVDSKMTDIPLAVWGSERRSQIMLFP